MHMVKPHRSCQENLSVTVKLSCKKAHLSAFQASGEVAGTVYSGKKEYYKILLISVWASSQDLEVKSYRGLTQAYSWPEQ